MSTEGEMQTGEVDTTRSHDLDKLAAALAKAQGAIVGASKSSVNPHFKNRYADLASIWDACRKPLSDNELAIIQTPWVHGAGVLVTTLLVHSSGQFVCSRLFMPATQQTAQGVGSAITYARRYALAAMVGVAPDDDDDANGTQPSHREQRPAPGPRSPSAPQESKPFATEGDIQAIWDRMDLAKTLAELKAAGTAANEAHLAPKDRERLSLFYIDRKKALTAQPAVAS